MKLLAIVPILFVIVKTNAQVDTVRTYYQKGQIRSVHPMLNGKVIGPVKYYYLNGSLESELIFKANKHIQRGYYENGNVKSFIVTQQNQHIIIKLYNSKGNIVKSEKKLRNGKKIKTWYDNNKLASFEKYSKGEPITCLLYPKVSAEPFCYCGYKQVSWNNNSYLFSDGRVANDHFKFKSYTFFETGKRKSKIIERRKSISKKVWDENGNLIINEIRNSKVEPILPSDDSSSNSETENGGEGWPILKTKNPFRDTIIQSNYISIINDSTIQYSFILNSYDSLGQNNSSGMDGFAIRSMNPLDDKLNPYLKEYAFYLSGNKEEFYMAIGISMNEADSLIIIAGSFYKDLILNKKLKINH